MSSRPTFQPILPSFLESLKQRCGPYPTPVERVFLAPLPVSMHRLRAQFPTIVHMVHLAPHRDVA